jgi:hypothetical protein
MGWGRVRSKARLSIAGGKVPSERSLLARPSLFHMTWSEGNLLPEAFVCYS